MSLQAPQARTAEFQPARAIVLGPTVSAQSIAESLRREGFEPRLERDFSFSLPKLSDADQIEKLRAYLENVRRESGGEHVLLHPGVSRWAERTELPLIGGDLGMTVVSPSASLVSLFNNKLNLLTYGAKLGIPHLLLSEEPMYAIREVEQLIERLSQPFPLVLKSIKGGAPGVLVLHSYDDLQKKFPLWLEQIHLKLGTAMILAERYVDGARHFIVPFFRLPSGDFEILPIVDASLQSRFKKVVELCGPDMIEPSSLRFIRQWTRVLAEDSNYQGVGTLEFLVDGSRAFLIEGLTRLNTSYKLWERVAGVSAVSLQLAAIREDFHARPLDRWKSAVSVRVYAEDPALQLPQPGFIHEVGETGLSSDAEIRYGVEAGQEVPVDGDGFLAQISAAGDNLPAAMERAAELLNGLWISGSLQTNERYLKDLLTHPWVKEGVFHAGFLDEEFIPRLKPDADTLSLFTVVCLHAIGSEHAAGMKWIVGDQWVKVPAEWADIPVEDAQVWEFQGKAGLSGTIRGIRFTAFPKEQMQWQVRLGSWFFTVRAVDPAEKKRMSTHERSVRKLRALVSGKVHSLLYRQGASVPAHENLIVLESLQSLVPHAVPVDVRILEWSVNPEQNVVAGQIIAELELC